MQKLWNGGRAEEWKSGMVEDRMMEKTTGMETRITDYLQRAQLEISTANLAAIQRTIAALIDTLGDVTTRLSEETLYTYAVPMLSEDGTCSLLEEVAPMPYDLSAILGGRSAANTRKLLLLNQLVEHATQLTGVDWLGVYQARTLPATAGTPSGARVLVKLAYRGRASRAEFPLTAEFAKGSTNSAVALTGAAKLIDDVTAHKAAGGAFYVCDDAVQSELCVPMFDDAGAVIGVIDAEAGPLRFFNADRQTVVVAMAMVVPSLLP